ncbi:hypothetical protein GPECTOR_66g253 [Gonium pectorale]|uniref:Uncharacterized protein n=1 Tax=Gonium pectorale TaxID=33097 RepID=A0A150G4S1_GONPE|nr:hypothetical protein GPECTOR_66g253 [Gonium pectorale]|eukprot:KXZ44525.1 hypothetical protein GPECTOR_66g253 [Gonium pectorale]
MQGCWTPLHLACLDGDLARVDQLLQGGVAVDSAGKGGWTPLHLALCGGSCEVVERLLAAGASASQATHGHTPLHCACFGGHVDVAELLISRGGSVKHPDKDGDSPLHSASHNGQTGVVEALLQARAPLDARNHDGLTPLHGACQGGHRDVVEALLRAGADHEAKTRDGKTPLDLARAEGFRGLADRLLQHAADMATSDGKTPLDLARAEGFRGLADRLLQHAADMATSVAPRSKVVLVGPGAAGKTALAHRLVHDEYKADTQATDNLQVHEWALKAVDQQQPTTPSIWDLGGQGRFWSTHAIFMSPEAVYIIVYNTKDSGQAASVDAYLRQVQTLAPGALNMVVGAWADKDEQDGVRSLRERMKQENKPRLVSVDVIRNMGAGVTQEADLHRFLSKLSDFGELIQFQHVPGLEDKVVIDPEWLADVLGDLVTSDKDKQQRLQLLEGPVSSMPAGHVSKRRVLQAMEVRCPGHANELVRILEAYGLLYLGDGERAIIPPTLPTLTDAIEKFSWEEYRAGVLRVVACGPDPELLGLLVSSQLALLREQFPGVKCIECGKHSDMSVHILDEHAVDWFQVERAGGESEGTIKLRRSLGAMERVVERIKHIPDRTALVVELRQSLVRRAVALHKLVGPSGGEHIPLAVLLPEQNGADRHNFELDLDSTTSGLPGSVRLHALCEYPGGLHLTDHPGYEVKEGSDWLRKHGRGLRPLLRALQLAGVSGPVGTLGAGNPEEEAVDGGHAHHGGNEVKKGSDWRWKLGRWLRPLRRRILLAGVSSTGSLQEEAVDGGREMQHTNSRHRSGVTDEGQPMQQLDSMLTCLDRLVEQQQAQLRAAAGSTTAGAKGGMLAQAADLYSACQEACLSVAGIVQTGNAVKGSMPRLKRVATRTAGTMWLCACHAKEELERTPLMRSL